MTSDPFFEGVRSSVRVLLSVLPGNEAVAQGLSLSPAEWREVLSLARTHGVPGLLLEKVRELSPPPEVIEELRTRRDKARVRGLWLARGTQDAAGVLRAAGIARVAPLKGTYLLPTLYGDYGARTTNDVDLLVPSGERIECHRAFVASGYQYIPKPEGRPVSQAFNYESSYKAPEGHVVDLHRGLSQDSRVPFDYEALWSRTQMEHKGALRGLEILSAEDTLLTLVIHLAQDSFQGPFRQWVDVAHWLQRESLSLELVVERAASEGMATLLWCTLYRLNELLERGLPANWNWKSLEPSRLRRRYLSRLLERRTLTPLSFALHGRIAQALTLLPVMDGMGNRTRFVGEYLSLRIKDPMARWGFYGFSETLSEE